MSKTAIIIPCYNESDRLNTERFHSFLNANPSIDLVFVNDGSKDNTIEILEKIKSVHTNSTVVSYTENKGKAEAIRFATHCILEKTEYNYIGYFDADLSTPLEEINTLLSILENKNHSFQMAAGSRIKRMGAIIQRNEMRHVGGRVIASIASYILQVPLYDTQCGAKILTKEMAIVGFRDSFTSKWLFDIELFARIIIHLGYKKAISSIYEYPLEKWIDDGKSRIKLKDLFFVPFELIRIYLNYTQNIQKMKKNNH